MDHEQRSWGGSVVFNCRASLIETRREPQFDANLRDPRAAHPHLFRDVLSLRALRDQLPDRFPLFVGFQGAPRQYGLTTIRFWYFW